MGGGEQHRVEDLAVCRRPPGELLAVPTGDTLLVGGLRLRERGGLPGGGTCERKRHERRQSHSQSQARPACLPPRTVIQAPFARHAHGLALHTRTSAASAWICARSRSRIGSTSSRRKPSVCCLASPVYSSGRAIATIVPRSMANSSSLEMRSNNGFSEAPDLSAFAAACE